MPSNDMPVEKVREYQPPLNREKSVSLQKLLEKELIVISGRNEKLPGHPLVYATSKSFMDYFGINSAEDLPRIREVLAEQLVEPTVIKDAVPEADASGAESGEAEPTEPQEPTDQHAEAMTEESGSQEVQEDVANDNNLESDTESEDIVFSVSESGELVEKPEDKE